MIKYDWNNIAMQKWNIFKGNLFSVKIEYYIFQIQLLSAIYEVKFFPQLLLATQVLKW
jgi:hypothetical protein